jgi:hypothetical protein
MEENDMPPRTRISFATCNLFNLHLPGSPIYRDADGWSQSQYDAKINWAFTGMDIFNDHLNRDDHKTDGTSDQGMVKASFEYHTNRG